MFTARKMFPRHNHPNNSTSSNINNNNARFGTEWRTLSRRSDFSREDTTDSESDDNQRRRFSNTWIYGGIAVLYLLIIAIVVTVLVLAPRYPSFYYYPPHPPIPSNGKPIDQEILGPIQDKTDAVAVIEFQPPPGKPFMPSPRDPTYHDHDMDPRFDLGTESRSSLGTREMDARSSLEMNDTEDIIVNLSRINNKFFNLSNIQFTN